jgi:TPR repeat protein
MNNPEFFSTQQTFTLQENEFNELVRLANQGDSEAALRVYHHYALGIQDESDADLLWLFRAAELSHPTAINDLGVHLTEDYLRKKLTKADQQRGWQILSQAADTGNEEARKFVRCK